MGSTQNFDSDIDESPSKNMHSQRTESITGFFMQRIIRSGFSSIFLSLDSTTSHPELSLNFLPCSVKIEGSTNQGLLLCTHIPPTYRNIPKPTTKQWKQIPNPRTRYRNKAIGMIVLISRPLHYKIVRFSQPKFRTNRDSYRFNNLRCEVFDSKIHAWKQLKEVVLHESFLGFNPVVSACGSLHWLTFGCKIFAFHFARIIIEKLVMLGEYEGNIALICKEDGERFMELWIIENYDRKTWRKKQRIILTGLGNASAALRNRINNLTLFNLKDGSSKSLRLEMGFDVVETFSFRSDFEHTKFWMNLWWRTQEETKNKRVETKKVFHD
uniref:F-box associated domain-containing protein n=1 Tax=Salix viminalis TaxID=40686 RepID=A0A6N2N7K1_SALVM